MTTSIDGARRALATAIAERTAAADALARANEAVDRARQFRSIAEEETRARLVEQRGKESAAAEAFSAHLRAGNTAHLEVTSAEVSEVLAPSSRARAQAEAREAVVRASEKALSDEVNAARAKHSDADGRVKLAAYSVLAAWAEVAAEELESARAVVVEREARLRALGRLPNPAPNMEQAPVFTAARKAITVAYKEPPQYAFHHDPETKALHKLRAMFEALCQNPDAAYDD